MKNLSDRYIKSIFAFLKKKKNFSFLNSAGVLLLVGILLAALQMNFIIRDKLKNENATFSDNNVYRDLTYIKPFTSLVGFNWKFSKENKRKSRETKSTIFTFSLIDLNPF